MAVIEKIRNRSGLLIGVIAVALIAFLVGDAMVGRGTFSGGNTNVVGEIDGRDISTVDYDNQVNLFVNRYTMNYGAEPDATTKEQISEQAWDAMVRDGMLKKEFDKLHIDVTESELLYITVGDNPHPNVVQNFKNPETGQFDRNQLINFLKTRDQNEKGAQQWALFEEGLVEQVISEKYIALIKGGFYRTKLEAKEKFLDRNRLAKVQSVGLNYGLIADSSLKYTDSDLEDYLNKNSDKYKRKEPARDIEYVVVDIAPSAADTAFALNWVNEKTAAFATAESDSAFVDLNSEIMFDTLYKAKGSLPAFIEDSIFFGAKGKMVGPVFNEGAYQTYKLTDIREDSVYTMRASHIIITPKGNTAADTAATYQRLSKILAQIRGGKDFAQMAKDSGQDGTAANGGDLGWFREGPGMSKAFTDAVKAHNKGDIYLAKSEFGWHIIKNTGDKYKRQVRVAVLSKTIGTSNNTSNELYSKVSTFASKAADDFDKAAQEAGLVKRVYNDLKTSDKQLPGLTGIRPLVSWAFNDDTDEGEISNVMTLENKFIVAKMVAVKKEGKPKLKDVRKQIEIDYVKDKKAEMLAERFKEAMANAKTPQELALAVKSIAQPIENQSFESSSLNYVGYEPKVVGAIFGSEKGKFSEVIKGDNGVFVVFVESVTDPADQKDYTAFRDEMYTEMRGRIDDGLFKALKENAKVKDYRYRAGY